MAKFDELNKNINDVLIKLLTSQDLCKLLTYTSNDPFLEPDIEDTSSLLFDKVYPIPKIPQPTDSEQSLITVTFDNFSLSGNIKFKDALLVFNVYCHIDLWRMTGTGKLRPYSIMEEIDKLFNDQRLLGIGKMQINKCRPIAANEKFWGFRLDYSFIDFN